MINPPKAAARTKATIDLDSKLVVPPVLLDGFASLCPVADPPPAVVGAVAVIRSFDAPAGVAVAVAAPVDWGAVATAPVMGICVNLISSGPRVTVAGPSSEKVWPE